MRLHAQLYKVWSPQSWHCPLNNWWYAALSNMRCRVLLFALVLVVQQLLDGDLLPLPYRQLHPCRSIAIYSTLDAASNTIIRACAFLDHCGSAKSHQLQRTQKFCHHQICSGAALHRISQTWPVHLCGPLHEPTLPSSAICQVVTRKASYKQYSC